MTHSNTGRSSILIADYILAKANDMNKLLTPMQVLKLTYISEGYSLAIDKERLFGDRIEAWKHGPVIPTLYHQLKKYGNEYVSRLLHCGTPISNDYTKDRLKDMKNTLGNKSLLLDVIVEKYGKLTGNQLSNLTHDGDTPWKKSYKRWKRGTEIPSNVIQKHYEELVIINRK